MRFGAAVVLKEEVKGFVDDLFSLLFEAHLDQCALIGCGLQEAGFGEEGVAIGVFEGREQGGEQAGREIKRIGRRRVCGSGRG